MDETIQSINEDFSQRSPTSTYESDSSNLIPTYEAEEDLGNDLGSPTTSEIEEELQEICEILPDRFDYSNESNEPVILMSNSKRFKSAFHQGEDKFDELWEMNIE